MPQKFRSMPENDELKFLKKKQTFPQSVTMDTQVAFMKIPPERFRKKAANFTLNVRKLLKK